ncbi:hypothetical protein QEN19_000107 [Hanseniaspora menglaensis]
MISNEPVPKEEEPILECLLKVRNQLTTLKQDRQKYLNSKTINEIYHKVLTKVHSLYEIRGYKSDNNKQNLMNNRLDSVLDDVMQLTSLSFITCGLKNTAPATFAHLSTVQRLLVHLEESKVYTFNDLRPIKERLLEIEEIVRKNAYKHVNSIEDFTNSISSNYEKKLNELEVEQDATEDLLLKNKLDECIAEYNRIENQIEKIDSKLEGLVQILYLHRRELLSFTISLKKSAKNGGSLMIANNFSDNDLFIDDEEDEELTAFIKNCQEKLKSIEDSDIISTGIATTLSGYSVYSGLFDECTDLVNDLVHQQVYHNGNNTYYHDQFLQQIYQRLIEIKTSLENLVITRRWTLRETDLYHYQKQLSDIEKLRSGSSFKDPGNVSRDPFKDEKKSPFILLYLLRRCYAIIYKLLESSEPISESMQTIHNQLSTVRRCLLDIKRMGGVDNERELYPYQLKLASLDNLRIDGKFYDEDGNIPEGQGSLNVLLSECFDIVQELKIEAEERGFDEESDQEDNDSQSLASISGSERGDDINIFDGSIEEVSTNLKKTSRRKSIPFTKDSSNRDVSELEQPNEEKEIEELRKQLQKLQYERQRKVVSQTHEDSDVDSDISYGSSMPISLTSSNKI